VRSTSMRSLSGESHRLRQREGHPPGVFLFAVVRRDSKGGSEKAPVEPFPAPGSAATRLRRPEAKQTVSEAENPTVSAK